MSSGADVSDGGECAGGAEYAEHCYCNGAEALSRCWSWVGGFGRDVNSGDSAVGSVG